jgi:hypothetical protein
VRAPKVIAVREDHHPGGEAGEIADRDAGGPEQAASDTQVNALADRHLARTRGDHSEAVDSDSSANVNVLGTEDLDRSMHLDIRAISQPQIIEL